MTIDFRGVDAVLQSWVDREVLPGVSYTVVRGGEVLARRCAGWADREARIPLGTDHLFRIFSNTKLVTCLAALQLLEQGRFTLDDPIGEYIPALGRLRVLRAGAVDLEDTEPAREPVRIRHLLAHTAGLTYGFLQPDSPIGKAYGKARVQDPALDLAQMMEALAGLPLLFQPGSAWNYSVGTDVVGRLVEVASGQTLDAYFRRHIFEPLGMEDTFFFVPPEKAARMAPLYLGDLREPLKPGLQRADHLPYPGAYLQPFPRLGAGGGLVSSLDDYTALVRALLRGGAPLLRPATMPLLYRNELAPGQWIGCPGIPALKGRGQSVVGSVTVEPSEDDPASVTGDLQWSGLAGTHWLVSPRDDIAAVFMTQRFAGSDLPVWPAFKQALRQALAAAR